jgi:hypothetical protein
VFLIERLERLLESKALILGTRVKDSLDELDRTGHLLAMKANSVVWTAVVSAVAGVSSIICAVNGVSMEIVVSLGLGSVASALLSSRER